MARQLPRQALRDGRGEAAARRLHEFLTAAANARIPANEIIVVHGLIVTGRVDLGSGAYLLPYEDVRIEFDLPDEPEPFQKKRTPNAAALVRGLEFGPGIDYRRRTRPVGRAGQSTASRPTTESTLRVGSRMPSSSSTCSRLRCERRCCPARVTCSYPHGYRKSTPTSRTRIRHPAGLCRTCGPRVATCQEAALSTSWHSPATGTRSQKNRMPWRSQRVVWPRHSPVRGAGSAWRIASRCRHRA